MSIRFIHCADLHLGYHQYNEEQRFYDFGRSFTSIVDHALRKKADYFLIAGDLFNKRSINSRTLMQAMEQLHRLKQADIPVIAIEGNHDKAPYGDADSWMWFLHQQGYFYLLTPSFADGELCLQEWNEQTHQGTQVRFPGIRFIGLGYQGSMTATRVQQLAEQLEPTDEFTVLLMHSAVDRLLHLGGIRSADLSPLKNKVDYVAMGHIHGRYEVQDWVYNPGSPECWDIGEADKEKGFYEVEVAQNGKVKEKIVQHIPSVRRDVLFFTVDVSDCETLDQVYETCQRELAQAIEGQGQVSELPIVKAVLQGTLPFSPLAVDMKHIEDHIQDMLPSLVVETMNDTLMRGEEITADQFAVDMNRNTLEQQVLEQFFREDPVARHRAGDFVQVARQVKELSAREASDESIAHVLEQLAEKIVEAEDEQPVEPIVQGKADEENLDENM